MPQEVLALTTLETSRLEALLRHVHRKEIECPVTPLGLTCIGFQDVSEVAMGVLRGLDEAGVRAVLFAVLAERKRR